MKLSCATVRSVKPLPSVIPVASRDRLRTTTNVLGDSIGAGIVEFLSRHELRSKDVEMGNSVLEEKEKKKPYKLISQDSDFENDKRGHVESHM